MFFSVLQFVVLCYGILLHRLRRSPLPEGALGTAFHFLKYLCSFSAHRYSYDHAIMAWFSLYKKAVANHLRQPIKRE